MSTKKKWKEFNRVAKAQFAFTPQESEIGKYQMKLEKDDIVVILSENSGWYKGHLQNKPEVHGMFPANYVKLQDISDTAKTHRLRGDTEVVKPGEKSVALTETEKEQILLKEVTSTIKDWMKLSRQLLADPTQENSDTNYFRVKSNIGMMLHWRGKLLSKSSSPAELEEIKSSMAKMLDGARRSTAGFLVPKNLHSMIQSGTKIEGPNFGIVELYDLHYKMKKDFVDSGNVPERYPSHTMQQLSLQDAFQQQRSEILKNKRRKINPLAHLYLEYNASPMSLNSAFEIYFSLFAKPKAGENKIASGKYKSRAKSHGSSDGKFISEEFLVYVTESGLPEMEYLDKLKTIFVNIETEEFDVRRNDLFLICKVYRVGELESKPKTGSQHKSSTVGMSRVEVSPKLNTYRRPYGVGVTSLSVNVNDLLDVSAPTRDITVLTAAKSKESVIEERFESLHLSIIDEYLDPTKLHTRNEMPKLPSWAQKGGSIAVRLFAFIYDQVKLAEGVQISPIKLSNKNAPSLKDVSCTNCYYLNKTTDPRTHRDDLYINLNEGSFTRDGKRSAKNILIKVSAVLDTGSEAKQLNRGTGPQNAKLSGSYYSAVFYHNERPRYNETIRMKILPEDIFRMHLLFVYYHVSTTARKTAPFGFSFLPLTKPDGSILKGGDHSLDVYKVMDGMGKRTVKPKYLNFGMNLKKIKRSDSFKVDVRLASTDSTCNNWLYQLLNWRRLNIKNDKLVSVMSNIRGSLGIAAQFGQDTLVTDNRMPTLAKVLSIILDIFGSIEEGNNKLIHETFTLFVYVLSVLMGEEVEGCDHDYLVTTYLSKVLDVDSERVHIRIVDCMTNLFKDVEKIGDKAIDERLKLDHSNIQSAMDSTHCFSYIMQFAISSAFMVAKKKKKEGLDPTNMLQSLKISLSELTYIICTMMRKRNLHDIQHRTLENFTPVFDALEKLFNPTELGEITREFFESIRTDDDIKEEIALMQADGEGKESKKKRGTYRHNSDNLLKLNIAKLKSVHQIVRGRKKLMRKVEFRTSILPCIIVMLKKHIIQWDQYDGIEMKYSVLIVKDLCTIVREADSFDDAWSMSYLLPQLLKLVTSLLGDDRTIVQYIQDTEVVKELQELNVVGHAISSLFGVIEMMLPQQMEHFLKRSLGQSSEHNSTQKAIGTFMKGLLEVCWHLSTLHREEKIYDERWACVCITHQNIALKILDWLGKPLQNDFLFDLENVLKEDEEEKAKEDDLSDKQKMDLWFSYLFSGLAMLNSDTLDLEGSSKNRRKVVLEQTGDIRDDVCDKLRDVWDALGKRKFSMIEKLVEPLLRLADLKHEKTRALSTDMYLSLFSEELKRSNNFSLIRFVTINAVDLIVTERSHFRPHVTRSSALRNVKGLDGSKTNSNSVGEERKENAPGQGFEELFDLRLRKKFQNDPLLNTGETLDFLSEVKKLFSLLSVLSKFGNKGNLEYEDEQTQAMLRLMAYLKKAQRDDMFVKYVERLKNIHRDLNNHSEAAQVLLMHATYPWQENKDVPAFVVNISATWPRESIENRRIRVFRKAIDLYALGKNWEKCLEYCELLRTFYEREFMYEELSSILTEQAKYYLAIKKQERFYPTHFRVSFLGLSYPVDIRNKVFIYRGAPLESIMEFSSRLRHQFPTAKSVPPGKEKDEMKDSTDKLYIQVSGVTTAYSEEWDNMMPAFRDSIIDPVKEYRKNCDVDTFWFPRPFRKNRERKAQMKARGEAYNEFMDLWNKKIFMRTEDTFPNVKRRLEVIETTEHYQNPLEVAVITVVDKNEDLKRRIEVAESLEGRTAEQSFTMAINGTVDAAVNGGIANYEPFLTGSYRTDFPEIAEDVDSTPEKSSKVQELKDALVDHFIILKRGVEIHGKVCVDAMIPLHEIIVKKFPVLLEMSNKKLGVKVPSFP